MSGKVGKCGAAGTNATADGAVFARCVMRPDCPNAFYAYRVRIRRARRVALLVAAVTALVAAVSAVAMAVAAPILLLGEKRLEGDI